MQKAVFQEIVREPTAQWIRVKGEVDAWHDEVAGAVSATDCASLHEVNEVSNLGSEASMKSRFHFPTKFARLLAFTFTGLLMSSCQGPPKDFDLWAASYDANNLPLNPRWGRQVLDGTLPDPEESCPMGSTDRAEWLSHPNCTTNSVDFNRWVFGLIGICHHVNFDPITYEGTVTWNGTGRTALDLPDWPFGDYDYTFNLSRGDHALYTRQDSTVHIEFDSRETVNLWDRDTLTWWYRFHHKGVDEGDDQARAMVDGRFAIVVGELGLDAPHRGKPELHPVYAMFVRLDKPAVAPPSTTSREATWAFFVRNWGNEGYCGYDQVPLALNSIKVQLPPPAEDLVDYRILVGAQNAGDLSSMAVTAQRNPEGMLFSFPLLPASKQSWYMGNLVLRAPPVIAARGSEEETITPQGLPPRTTNEPEEKIPPQLEPLRAQIENLPASSRKELIALLENAVPRRQGQQQEGRVIMAAPTQVRATRRLGPGRVMDRSGLDRLEKDTAAELDQRKKLEVLRKFFAERGIRVDLPRQ